MDASEEVGASGAGKAGGTGAAEDEGARRPSRERKSVERMRSSYLSAPTQKKEGGSSAKKEGTFKRKSTESKPGSGKKKRTSAASLGGDNDDLDLDLDLDVPLIGLVRKDEPSGAGSARARPPPCHLRTCS